MHILISVLILNQFCKQFNKIDLMCNVINFAIFIIISLNNQLEMEEIDSIDDEFSAGEKPEDHLLMKNITANWKLIGIISAFVNRCILEKVDINKNLTIKDRKIITSTNTGDPTILNVANVDVYSLNLFSQIHKSFDIDLKYLKAEYGEECDDNSLEINSEELTDSAKETIDKLLIGLTTLNEQTVNFLSDGFENLYDQKIKKVIEYFIRQRDYYISIGRIKIKYNDNDNKYGSDWD